jgi:hypothetical protein
LYRSKTQTLTADNTTLAFSRLLCLSFDGSCSLHISHAFSTSSCSLENFRDIDFHLSLWFYSVSLISSSFPPDPTVSVSVSFGPVLSVSLLNTLSPFDCDPFDTAHIGLLRIRQFDSIRFDSIRFDSRLRMDSSKQFRVLHVNSSFFSVLYTGKPNLEVKTRFCKLSVRFSRLAIA